MSASEWGSGPAAFEPDPRIREYPGTFIRDWIILCRELPDPAFRAYCVIRAHIWEKDERREVTLTQEEIARMLDKSTDRVRKIIKPLLAVGLIRVAGKKEWYVYNAATKRNERRAMNTYAVTDFPADDYEGPKSLADFRRRFAELEGTDRSKTTGQSAPDETAGQTDRAKTTGGSSSQVSDISAGQTDRSKTASGAVENDPPSKNSFKNGGGEGDARARVSEDPSPTWGVSGRRRETAPSLEAADLIADIAARVLLEGEELSIDDHQELAAMVDAVRSVVDDRPGLSWSEYVRWLHHGWVSADGRRRFTDFSAILRWRLRPEQVQGKAWPWACEQRGAQQPSHAPGGREAPKPPAATCGRHGTKLLDHRCVVCDQEAAEEDRQRREREEAASARAAAEELEDQEEPPPMDEGEFSQMFNSLYPDPDEAARRKEEALAAYRAQVAERRAAAK